MIITILWLFLPMAIANMGPVLAHNIHALRRYDYPLDFHKTFRGKRIFGDHKTIRGIIAGTIVGMLVALIQYIVVSKLGLFESYTYSVDYSRPTVVFMGACIGFGAMAGDAIKSFFKRQMDIAPGKSWVPFDQLDFAVGALIASAPFFHLPLHYYVVGVAITLLLHPTINVIAWLLRLQERPF